jgi:hypothetical protein
MRRTGDFTFARPCASGLFLRADGDAVSRPDCDDTHPRSKTDRGAPKEPVQHFTSGVERRAYLYTDSEMKRGTVSRRPPAHRALMATLTQGFHQLEFVPQEPRG